MLFFEKTGALLNYIILSDRQIISGNAPGRLIFFYLKNLKAYRLQPQQELQ